MPVRPAHGKAVHVAVKWTAFAATRNERAVAQRIAPTQSGQSQRQINQCRIPRTVVAGVQTTDALARAAAQQHCVGDRGRQVRGQSRASPPGRTRQAIEIIGNGGRFHRCAARRPLPRRCTMASRWRWRHRRPRQAFIRSSQPGRGTRIGGEHRNVGITAGSKALHPGARLRRRCAGGACNLAFSPVRAIQRSMIA